MREDLIKRCEELFRYLSAGDWEHGLALIAPDLRYTVADEKPMTGPESVKEYLTELSKTLRPLEHNVRNAWQVDDNTVVMEGVTVWGRPDGSRFSTPFCDIYGFENGLLKDWRVYVVGGGTVSNPEGH